MKRNIFLLIICGLFSLSSYADPYTCINKKSAEAIIIANLGKNYHRYSTNEQQDIDSEIDYYLAGLIKTEAGYISLGNSYFNRTVLISCLGIFDIK